MTTVFAQRSVLEPLPANHPRGWGLADLHGH